MCICPFTAPFLWANWLGSLLFQPQKRVTKVSIKNVENIKNEFSALSTSKLWYDMPETHNLSQRTVDPKLVDDSATLVFSVTGCDFWINSRKLL